MRKATVAACIAALMLALLAACGAPESTTTQTPAPGDTILESAEGRVVKMTVGETEIYITLNDSQAAAALAQMLPLETELIERAYFAKGMLLPSLLPDTEETTREYAVGDLGYWADGQCKNRHPSPICMQFGHHPAGVSAPLSRSEAPMPYNWFSTAIL